jgi:hypothetical protein
MLPTTSSPERFEVKFRRGHVEFAGDYVIFRFAENGYINGQPSENGPPRSWLDFSPIEEEILKAATTEWQTAVQLATKIGQKRSTWLCAILANLVERRLLEGSRYGYRLASGIKLNF